MVLEQKKKHLDKLLKRTLSQIIHRRTKDPRIGFVTITRISLSNDLRNAKVYVSILGDQNEQEKCLKGLHSATNFIKSKLASELKKSRFIPTISFHLDRDLEKAHQIMIKIGKLEEERKNSDL